MKFLVIAALFSTVVAGLSTSKVCVVPAAGNSSIDDTPAVLKAFDQCGHGGKILFENTTYHINSVMKTTGLKDVEIDLKGTLLVWISTLAMHDLKTANRVLF
jgi:hypothetical protein